jgi:hypothetical protein
MLTHTGTNPRKIKGSAKTASWLFKLNKDFDPNVKNSF